MTTAFAAEMYESQHLCEYQGYKLAIYNPSNKPVEELPLIYGFNNGGSVGWMTAQLIAEDGTELGSHLCSSEAYMPADLGILEGTREDRHEGFRLHYPDGYKMEFVGYADVPDHKGLNKAFTHHGKSTN